MRFSTRTRYGLRFLLQLAALPKGSRLQLSQVARMEQISSGYLEQIVRALRPLGILRGVRGSGGGYQLSRAPADINLEDVFQNLEGDLGPVHCLHSRCTRSTSCTTRTFWEDLDKHIRRYLRSITLQDLLERSEPTLQCSPATKVKKEK
ncbi:MAG: Rrf2 family transcriptional regulator [Desulfovibrio sp.]|nr:Rrf2 family transcriptional regulator [Desulfovibrio sp.]